MCTVVENDLERVLTLLITSINNQIFPVKVGVVPVSWTPFVTALQLIETWELGGGATLQGLCGLGWCVACTAPSERHGKHKPSSAGWVCPECQQNSFTPSKREPDVTSHSALALFVMLRQPPRKCPFRDEDKALLCITWEGCFSESIRHYVLVLTWVTEVCRGKQM